MYQNALFMGNKYSLLCTLDIHTKVSWYTPKICGLATKLSVVYSATQWFVRSSLEYLIFGPVFLGFMFVPTGGQRPQVIFLTHLQTASFILVL